MKKYLSVIALLMMGLMVFTACGDDEENDPVPSNFKDLKVNVLYATIEGKTYEFELDGIGGNALNPRSSEENSFTFFDGPCDIHLQCNFKTGNGTGDIQYMGRYDEEGKLLYSEYERIMGEGKCTNCRYDDKGLINYNFEGEGEAFHIPTQKVYKAKLKARIRQTSTVYYPQQ